jgi:hypothetical protein
MVGENRSRLCIILTSTLIMSMRLERLRIAPSPYVAGEFSSNLLYSPFSASCENNPCDTNMTGIRKKS